MAERKRNRNALFSLDHKLYASDYDSDSVASENHCENRPLQAALSRLSPARPRFSRNFSHCAFLSCSLELVKGKLWAGETEKPPQVQTLLFTKTATDSEGLEYRLPNDCDAISGHCFVENKRKKQLGNLLLSVALYGIIRHQKWNFSFSGRQNKEKKNRYWNFLLSLIMTLSRFYPANKIKTKIVQIWSRLAG